MSFWSFLKSLFGIKQIEVRELPAAKAMINRDMIAEATNRQNQRPETPINRIFQEVLNEIAQEQASLSDELPEEKLRELFKTTIRKAILAANNELKDTYLLDSGTLKLTDRLWKPFCAIFTGVAKELGIKTVTTADYLHIDTASLLAVTDKLKGGEINIDEKVRMMLHTGIYR